MNRLCICIHCSKTAHLELSYSILCAGFSYAMPPSKAFFYSVREMSGKTLESLLSARNEIDQMRELSAQVFAGQPVHETVRHFRRDGKFLEIEINAVPLRRGGRVQGAYAIYNDVSERAKAEEEAKKHADSLKRWVEELQLRTTQMSLLNEMGDLLQ